MIKSTIIILAGAGIIGTGSQTVSPQAFEISAGAIAYEISVDGLKAKANKTPEFGMTLITKDQKELSIRF